MNKFNKFLAIGFALLTTLLPIQSFGQSAVIRGQISAGNYVNIAADALGNLKTTASTTTPSQTNIISTVNSSTALLGNGGAFTGTAEDVTNYSEARVSVFSDQASATDGLQLQQSSNGTNWDNVDSYSVPASTGKSFGAGIGAQFFRIVYTNGVTPQGSFRLSVIYHSVRTKPSAIRSQDGRSNDNDFEEQASYGQVYNGTSWDRARGDVTAGAWSQNRASSTGGYSFSRINTNTTTVVKSGVGTLHTIVNGTVGTTSTIQCFDNTAGSGTVILTLTTVTPIAMIYDVAFTTGLTCVTAGAAASDLTVSFK